LYIYKTSEEVKMKLPKEQVDALVRVIRMKDPDFVLESPFERVADNILSTSRKAEVLLRDYYRYAHGEVVPAAARDADFCLEQFLIAQYFVHIKEGQGIAIKVRKYAGTVTRTKLK
jgi:hypothetical protein